MTIAIGGIYHESNSFASVPTTLDDFRASSLEVGDGIVDRWSGTDSEIGGFLVGAERHDWDVSPTLMAWGMPSGAVTDDALEEMTEELCRRLAATSDLDGVLLVVHGAMLTPTRAAPDGWWLGRVRATLGDDVPIVATADLHGNITPEMLQAVDGLIGYDTYPHVDFRERGEEATSLLARIIAGAAVPEVALAQVPIMPFLLSQFTGSGPMQALVEAAHEVERRPGVLWASVFGGFQWADAPHAGMSVVVATDGDPNASGAYADELACQAWDLRHEFAASVTEPAVAVREALGAPAGPVVLVDAGDNVGGGTPGDGTVLLAELARQRADGALVLIADAESVERAVETGVRCEANFRIGGKTDAMHGEPVKLRCRVRAICDGIYTNIGPMRDGIVDDMGRTAVLDANGLTVVATERKMPMWNLQQLRALGIEPTSLAAIVVKAAIAHRAAYDPIAAKTIYVDTPGITALDPRKFSYSRLSRPFFPLDPDMTYSPSAR